MNKNIEINIKRIISDILDLNKDPITNIYIHTNEENINEIYAMIVGEKDTPYYGGYYIIKLTFTKKYPFTPPKGTFCTTNGNIRFNPNLYENGYICLSILGTWQGPGWSSIMTTKSILLSIQSLLNNNPITNEPGYNNIKLTDQKSINYNSCLEYHNFKFAILEMLINPKEFIFFHDIMKTIFLKNYDSYIQRLKILEKEFNNKDKSIKCPIYRKTSIENIDYKSLIQKFKILKLKLDNNENIIVKNIKSDNLKKKSSHVVI
jgi:ubiquitin-protein ligase